METTVAAQNPDFPLLETRIFGKEQRKKGHFVKQQQPISPPKPTQAFVKVGAVQVRVLCPCLSLNSANVYPNSNHFHIKEESKNIH